jgi:hypothetical protein
VIVCTERHRYRSTTRQDMSSPFRAKVSRQDKYQFRTLRSTSAHMVSLLRAVPIAGHRKIPLSQRFADPKTLVGKDIGGGRWLRHAAVPTFEQPETCADAGTSCRACKSSIIQEHGKITVSKLILVSSTRTYGRCEACFRAIAREDRRP